MSGRYYPIDEPATSPIKYGTDAPIVKLFRVPLDTALVNERFDFGGSTLWAVNASDITAEASIKLGDQQRDGIPFFWGTQVSGVRFDKVYVSCSAQPGKYLDILVTTAENIQIQNPASAYSSVAIIQPDTFIGTTDVSCVAGASTVIAAADSTRFKILVKNLETNSNTIRVGCGNTNATRGIPLTPGESIELQGADAVRAWNTNDAGTGDESVAVLASFF